METLEEKITRALKDKIEIVPYDACRPEFFEAEKNHLQKTLPPRNIFLTVSFLKKSKLTTDINGSPFLTKNTKNYPFASA